MARRRKRARESVSQNTYPPTPVKMTPYYMAILNYLTSVLEQNRSEVIRMSIEYVLKNYPGLSIKDFVAHAEEHMRPTLTRDGEHRQLDLDLAVLQKKAVRLEDAEIGVIDSKEGFPLIGEAPGGIDSRTELGEDVRQDLVGTIDSSKAFAE